MLSLLSLYPASPEQIKESRRRTSQEWGRGMTEQEYVERDELTDQSECARDGRLITWVLGRRDAHESLDFFCSCETFRRPGLMVRRTTLGPHCDDVIGYGIASVFTLPAHRRKGYAKHMLRLLHWVLAPKSCLPEVFPGEWGDPPARVVSVGDACFSTLWSDVGPDLYRLCGTSTDANDGWNLRNPISTTWDVPKKLYDIVETQARRQWVWLDETAIRESWRIEAELMKRDVVKDNAAALQAPYIVGFSFLPHLGVAEFQYCRTQFFWEKLDPRPLYWGITSLEGNEIFASWTIEINPLKPKTLIMTRLRTDIDTFEDLFLQIMAFAKHHTIEKVEVWNLDQSLSEIAKKLGGETFERMEHLSSFKWYGKESPDDVQWMFNERFCWC